MKSDKGRCGYVDYARMLRAVVDGPITTRELAHRCGLRVDRLRKTLLLMASMGIIFEVALRPGSRGNQAEVVWGAYGPPSPARARGGKPGVMSEVPRFCRLVHALMAADGGLSVHELSEASGISLSALRPVLREFLRLKLVFVRSWRRSITPGRPTALLAWGVDRRSANRPAPIPAPELWKRYKEMRARRLESANLLFMTAGRPAPNIIGARAA